MATWIAHLRVAENLLNKGFNFDVSSFLIGNIGPDSGVPNEDYSSFYPPREITHWEKNKISDAEGFFNKYIQNAHPITDKNEFSFKIGYYTHLLTDIEWRKLYEAKKKTSLYKENLDKDKKFIWVIKEDWYGLDFLYLDKNPNCYFFKVFKNLSEVPDYLDYFPKGAFTKSVKNICEYYLGENTLTKENFKYLTEEEMNKFIENATNTIEIILKEKLKSLNLN